jgi:hypothetical protein
MNVNGIRDQVWASIIEGTVRLPFEFLGLQLLLTNLRQRLRTKETSMPAAIVDLKGFFVKYSGLRAAQNDFNKIAQLGGYHA